MQGSSERPVPVCDASASASAMASHSNMHLPSPIAICNAPTGQSKPPLTSHITQLWRAAHCQDVPAVAQEIRRHGDTQALLGPRQHRGVRGRLQTGLETNSALSAYAACNCVGSCGNACSESAMAMGKSSPHDSPRNLHHPPSSNHCPALSLSSCVSPVITDTQRANSILSCRRRCPVFHTSISFSKDSSEIVLLRHHLAASTHDIQYCTQTGRVGTGHN